MISYFNYFSIILIFILIESNRLLQIVKVDHPFSSPLIYIKIDNHTKLNDLLIKESYEWKRLDNGNDKSNKGNGWQSPETLMLKKTRGFKNFTDIIPNAAALAVSKINPQLQITDYTYKANAWVNINQKGGYNSIHHHGEFHLSGVYYVKNSIQDYDNGKIEFINSRNDYNIHKVIGGNAFSTSIRVTPKEGFMIIFPSSLLHLVHPNNTNEDRISIAWNIKFEKKIS